MAYKKKTNRFIQLLKFIIVIALFGAIGFGIFYAINYDWSSFFDSITTTETSVVLNVNNNQVTTYSGNQLSKNLNLFELENIDSTYSLNIYPITVLQYSFYENNIKSDLTLLRTSTYESLINKTITSYFDIQIYDNYFLIDFTDVSIEDIIVFYKTDFSNIELLNYNESNDYFMLSIVAESFTLNYQFNLIEPLLDLSTSGVIF